MAAARTTKKPAPNKRPAPPPQSALGAMAGPLREILEQRGLSARGLSLAAGLPSDTVRNLLSGRARRPRGEVGQALADYLRVPLSALYGKEPVPPPPRFHDLVAATRLARVPELGFHSRRDVPHPLADLRREEVADWTVPRDWLDERRLDPGSLRVVMAPEDGEAFKRGDRLIVDTADIVASPPGPFLIWDGYAVGAAWCQVVARGGEVRLHVRRPGRDMESGRIGDDLEPIGRVVGRCGWL